MNTENRLDERAAQFPDSMAQTMSRRGLLTRLGGLALKVVGLSVVPFVLPVDRAFAQFGCTNDWQTCNMHGYFCKACCDQGASYSVCPSCTTRSTVSWTGCCENPSNCNRYLIRYYDCCGGPAAAADCRGTGCGWQGSCPPGYPGNCPPDGQWPAYCSGGAAFRCTIVWHTGTPC